VSIPEKIGRYAVKGELGRGAMGVVYRGVDPALDRHVAIKVISAGETAGDASLEELEGRFLREARIAAKINHPGVVTVHDAGREGADLYLVMELVEGESLADQRRRGIQRSPSEVFDVVADVADALAAAHAHHVVHRDIKPANILFTKDGRCKVTDFGVAKAVGEGTELTRTGMVIGSPAYMAPEQVKGDKVDHRADIFSLGVVAYEMLFGRKPFPADTVTTLIYQILHEDPVADPEVVGLLGPEVASFLRKCLAKKADDRFADATNMATEARALVSMLREISSEMTTVTRLPQRDATVRVPEGRAKPAAAARPNWIPFAVAGGALVALVAVVLALISGKGEGKAEVVASAPVVVVATPTPAPEPTASPVPTEAPTPTPAPPTPVPTLGFRRVAGGPASPMDGSADRFAEPTAPPRTSRSRWSAPVQAPASQPQDRRARPAPTTAPAPDDAQVAGTYECRQAAQFNIKPKDTRVTVNGQLIGVAGDFGGGLVGRFSGKLYSFSGFGTYLVEFSLEGYQTVRVEVVVRPEAEKRVANLDFDLHPLPGVEPRDS